MNTTKSLWRSVKSVATIVATLSFAPLANCADSVVPWPAGAVDFSGRMARNHWYLMGREKRAELETINRELREAQRELDRGTDADAQRAATERGRAAANRLLEHVKNCPRLIRADLTAPHPALTPGGPLALPGDTGALLLEVVTGGEGLGYSATVFDLSLPPGESSLATVEVSARGTNYAVVGLERLPFGRTTMAVEFRWPGQPGVRLPLDVTTPPPGRLKLTVLSDDTGKPASAMVQLLSRRTMASGSPPTASNSAFSSTSKARPAARATPTCPGSPIHFGACPNRSTWRCRRATGASACGVASNMKSFSRM